MSKFEIFYDWAPSPTTQDVAMDATTAFLKIAVDGFPLTKNNNIWSKTVSDQVLLSLYPLATWFVASWWRLNFEPLPKRPTHDWRMSHEIAAAGEGFVWPKIIFASDGHSIAIWAKSFINEKQSVHYLQGLEAPYFVKISDFQKTIDYFVHGVLERLQAIQGHGSDLGELWNLLHHEREDLDISHQRRLEAQLGFDPEECPPELLKKALRLQKLLGTQTLSELAPIYGKSIEDLRSLENLKDEDCLLKGNPDSILGKLEIPDNISAPWERGIQAAKRLREKMGVGGYRVKNNELSELLGISAENLSKWPVNKSRNAAIAISGKKNQFKFFPRRSHPNSKRFEAARFVGDLIFSGNQQNQWLASTDLPTVRQKFQRAFAAEFLCPLDSLLNKIDNDFDNSASLEDAAVYFGVSEETVKSILKNNNYLSRELEYMPY